MKPLALFVLLFAIAGCGRPGPGSDPDSDDWMDGIPGTYAMDARRTLGKTIPGPDGTQIELTEEKLAQLQASHGATQMRLVLKDDGTFELFSGTGESAFRTAGTWKETATGMSMVTTTVNGEPAPTEVQVVENYEIERGYLIGRQGATRVYMKKQKPTK